MNKENRIGNLLGHPITHTSQISLSDQIYDVICTEIFAKRWQAGEKLPSMAIIAKQCGCSRMPAQEAIERLGSEGYIKQVPRSGLFLADPLPKAKGVLGTIGILVRVQQKDEQDIEFLGHEQLLIHRLLSEIENYNYKTHVVYVDEGDDLKDIQKDGHIFQGVKGIISLFTFPHNGRIKSKEGEIPIVFWCIPDHRCSPCVASDYELAVYQLTNRVINRKHTEIFPVPCSLLRSYVADRYWSGYSRAMKDAGLKPQEQFYSKCKEIKTRDTAKLKKLISQVDKCSAYICFSKQRSEELMFCLTDSGVKVPKQVSVTGVNPPFSEISSGLILTGIGFSPEKEIETCIKLLQDQMRGEISDVGTIMLTPFYVAGNTLVRK